MIKKKIIYGIKKILQKKMKYKIMMNKTMKKKLIYGIKKKLQKK